MADIARLLDDSLDAIHRQNTRRPIECPWCPLTFLRAEHYFAHRAHRHTHPSTRTRP